VIVGVPREVKDNEFRVAITPEGVRELRHHGHTVLVETGAGHGSSLEDEQFIRAGGEIAPTPREVFDAADLVLKVKEPVRQEYDLLREGQILFTFLHLAADADLTRTLVERKVAGVAYETVQLADGALPLLAPMSEVAGRMAPHVGAGLLEREHGGRGVLMGGVSGVHPARVLILGAGMAGSNAAWIAAGMEAEVVVVDRNLDRLRYIDQIQRGRILTLMSHRLALEKAVRTADLLIGAVLVPGARAPKLVSAEMVASMRPGSVIIDVSVDQGGCVETSRMTTHSQPTYVDLGVVHYCVGNMPGAVPHTSTYALTNVTLPYAVEIAEHGLEEAVARDAALARGVNTYGGHLTNAAVGEAHGLDRTRLAELIPAVAS
jgi:alanine dehydrogenase